MAIPAVPNANLGAINRILAEIGRSIDDKTEAGARISDGEAQKIIGHLDALPKGERAAVQTELQKLLTQDFFTVTPEARKQFAQAFGVETKDLEPKDRAELVGLASARSAFQAGVQALAKTPQIDRKTMKRLVEGAEMFLDRPAQAYLAAVLRNASRDGALKLDTEARKGFTKWVGGLDQQGLVSDWAKGFDMPGAGNVDYLSQLMASGMCFEDLVAAFMMHIAGQLQKETTEKMEEIKRNEELIKKREQGAQPSKLNDLFKSRGLDQGASAPAAGAAPTSPAAEPPPTQPALSPEYAAKTKRNLEAVVQSVHAHMSASDDTPNVIDAKEAGQIAEKFARLEGPVAKLIAGALMNTLRSTPGVYLEGATFKPMVDWMKSQLGDDVDLSPLPRRNPSDPNDPIAKQLRSSDKLEDKIASFIVDTLLSSDTALKDKMQDLKQLTSDMLANPATQAAYEHVVKTQPDSAKALVEAAAAKGETVEQGAKASAPAEAAVPAEAGAPAGDPAASSTSALEEPKSRQMLWEDLKNLQNQLAQIMQALSNILNAMHQNAMNSIRAIR